MTEKLGPTPEDQTSDQEAGGEAGHSPIDDIEWGYKSFETPGGTVYVAVAAEGSKIPGINDELVDLIKSQDLGEGYVGGTPEVEETQPDQ